ncbi:MAG: hypothetical protein FK734_01820 [Asgard group archaeon]|nr:hypothetical protein [Asgard group archaeon]
MRIITKKNGQMRVIEAILASFIIIFALAFVNFFNVNPSSERYEITELNKLGYNVLHDLDTQGLLANYVYNENWENLRNALSVTLPVDVYFNLTVTYLNQNARNTVTMSYGELQVFKNSNVVSSITYPVVGYPKFDQDNYPYALEADYDPSIVILQLVRG